VLQNLAIANHQEQRERALGLGERAKERRNTNWNGSAPLAEAGLERMAVLR